MKRRPDKPSTVNEKWTDWVYWKVHTCEPTEITEYFEALRLEVINQGDILMSVASELRAAIAANALETERIAKAYATLTARAEADAAEMDRLKEAEKASEAEKAALAAKVTQAEADKQATAAELAELKTAVEADTLAESVIGAAPVVTPPVVVPPVEEVPPVVTPPVEEFPPVEEPPVEEFPPASGGSTGGIRD